MGKYKVTAPNGKEIAYDILEKATGKNKIWLKSRLEGKNKKLSTQKQSDLIRNLTENSENNIEEMLPEWINTFGHRDLSELNAGSNLANDALDMILGGKYKPFKG